jgi:hypothetical protein
MPHAGAFVMVAFAGHELPTLIDENLAFRGTLLADTLVLDANGRGQRTRWYRTEFLASSQPPIVSRTVTDLTITRRDGSLRASEHVMCLANHASETCPDLWDTPVAPLASGLQIGHRTYRRIHAAP